MVRSIEQTITIKSESPFNVEWMIKNEHPFLKSLKDQVERLCPLQKSKMGGDLAAV